MHVGLAGVGRIGAFHANGLVASPHVERLTIADADPMHRKGARRHEIRLWLLNEGNLGIDVLLSQNTLHFK